MSAVVHQFPDRFDVTGNRWEPWIDEQKIAAYFGVSTATIRRRRLAGMPSEKQEGCRRYRVSECENWLRGRAS